MARPLKEGLLYFSLDVDVFEDDKLFDIQNLYGPLGEIIYLRLLCLIYKNGYYYKFDNLDKLAAMLIKSIGNRWARDKQQVKQVILCCAESNLFSLELMQNNVLTSASIQKRYFKAAERRNLKKDLKYIIVTDSEIVVSENTVNADNNLVNANNNLVNVGNNTTKKSKENKSKENKSKVNKIKPIEWVGVSDVAVIAALQDFEEMRKTIKAPMTEKSRNLLINNLNKISTDTRVQIAVLEQSILNNWKTVYPLKGDNNKKDILVDMIQRGEFD